MNLSQPSISSKKRLIFIFIVTCTAIFGLIIRLGWIQIVRGERYKELAIAQQTRDIPIPAKRGTIFDRNGKELVKSASTNTVWARPREITDLADTAGKLAEILDLDPEKLAEKLGNKNVGTVKVIQWIENDLADTIRKLKLKGIMIAEDNRRYYPFGNFASYILGHTTDDNRGLAGIELEYEKFLSGYPGRWIKNTDGAGRQLPFSSEKYYPSEDGYNIVLTIDEVIQHFAEKAVQNALEAHQAKRVMAVVMDVKTGDILAMVAKPDYDPNQPRVNLDPLKQQLIDLMTTEKKVEEWNKMWRNPIINDTYEPGSTFKLITTAAALEERVTTPESTFYSNGFITVAGRTIKCWRYYNPHGNQTLAEAVQNSCNPIFVELAQRMGSKTFYSYLDAFGFRDVTGIDLPGERKSIMYSEAAAGPVELATMSFGQSISVTPIQLLTAVAAIANEGKLMKPRIVKELTNSDGMVIERFEETMIRQVISKQTSQEMLAIMESVVAEGSGKNAYIPGYKVGGKTGTAQKVVDGKYSQGLYVSSFIGVAPTDNPRLAILVIVDEPGGFSTFGSITSAPVVKEILEESLRYLDIKPNYTNDEKEKLMKADVNVPDVRQMTIKEASKVLSDNKLLYNVETESNDNENAIIIDMFPKPGAAVPEKSIILLYTKNSTQTAFVEIPNLTGKTIREANNILTSMGLKMKISGSGIASGQSPDALTKVEQGSIVSVEFKSH